MRLIRKVLAVGIILGGISIFPPNVYSGYYTTGNQLFDWCRESTNTAKLSNCLGFITGVHDALELWQEAINAKTFCTPSGVTIGQMKDVVVKYLGQNPEARHFSASSEVYAALVKGFPCPKNPANK